MCARCVQYMCLRVLFVMYCVAVCGLVCFVCFPLLGAWFVCDALCDVVFCVCGVLCVCSVCVSVCLCVWVLCTCACVLRL